MDIKQLQQRAAALATENQLKMELNSWLEVQLIRLQDEIELRDQEIGDLKERERGKDFDLARIKEELQNSLRELWRERNDNSWMVTEDVDRYISVEQEMKHLKDENLILWDEVHWLRMEIENTDKDVSSLLFNISDVKNWIQGV